MNEDQAAGDTSANRVLLRGRLAAAAETKVLPSGDLMSVFRLTVDRPAGDRVKVDSLECVTVRSRPRRTLERAEPGDIIEVSGRLHRRFWRGPAGPASRYAVDVTTARVVRRVPVAVTGRATGGTRARKPVSG